MYRYILAVLLAAGILSLSGCADSRTAAATEETVEFNGIVKNKSELSEDTLKWLDWYNSLPEHDREALSMIPSEFVEDRPVAALETGESQPSYCDSLTEKELQETMEMARYYFIDKVPECEGVELIEPAQDDDSRYQNAGLEGEYGPGNIIIYMVETARDIKEGNPMRSISIARKSKSDEWKVINCGY